MNLKEQIFGLLRRKDYSPLRLDELQKALGGDRTLFRKLKKILPRLVRAGELTQEKRGRFRLPAPVERLKKIPFARLRENTATAFCSAISPNFPDAVAAEIADVPDAVAPQEFSGRIDLRDTFVFTIDPAYAHELDDALSLETLPDEKFRVGVHITDVSHYVRAGMALDAEARLRGNSSLLVGDVIPMLPREIAQGICSLDEGETRLTKSVFATFDAAGTLVETSFANSVIASRKRLSYCEASALLSDETDAGADDAATLKKILRKLREIAEKLRTARIAAGALDSAVPEITSGIDANGNIYEADDAHHLVEEFMLLANEIVARKFFEAEIPFISRVNDAPDRKKLDALRKELFTAGIEVGDLSDRRELANLLAALGKCAELSPLRARVLRCLKPACYRASADGHFALAKEFYAHFTSPLRRYADLSTHRIFDFYLQKNHSPTAPAEAVPAPSPDELAATAAHLSEMARRAKTELESANAAFEHAAASVGKIFAANIVDVRSAGLVVELKNLRVRGSVPLASLSDDSYRLDPDGTAIVGRRSRKRYALGQSVFVAVDSVDRSRFGINFRLSVPRKVPWIPKFFRSCETRRHR